MQEIGNQYNSKEKQILINHICCTGCHKTGYYTSDCSIPCPDVNCQHCHIETGACQGCKPGQQCELGKYSVMNVIFFVIYNTEKLLHFLCLSLCIWKKTTTVITLWSFKNVTEVFLALDARKNVVTVVMNTNAPMKPGFAWPGVVLVIKGTCVKHVSKQSVTYVLNS